MLGMVRVDDDDGPRKRPREAMDRVTSVTNGAQKSKEEEDLSHDPMWVIYVWRHITARELILLYEL